MTSCLGKQWNSCEIAQQEAYLIVGTVNSSNNTKLSQATLQTQEARSDTKRYADEHKSERYSWNSY